MAAQPLGEPPAGAVKADIGFPAPGTRWIARFISAKGVTTTNVYTILEDGLRESKPVHRMSYGNTITLYDRETANHVATTVRGKETIFYSPHVGTFSWPLYVGKTWTARYVYHDRVRDTIIDPVLVEYRVEALETVAVPAGSWNAFKIQSKSAAGNSLSTIWYAPELKLIVKRVNETTVGHSSGVTKTLYEITEYPAKPF
jgi:hypothetical protein